MGEEEDSSFQVEKSDPKIITSQELTYDEYLKISEITRLQKPRSRPPHHDEMLFIVIHQAYELWFKLILHELEQTAKCMERAEVLKARHFVNRSVQVMKLLVNQIHILETMNPVDFLAFRDRINPASGFQSIQFREVEFFSGLKDKKYFQFFKNRPEILARLEKRFHEPDLRTHYYQMLAKLGFEIPPLPAPGETESSELRESLIQQMKGVFQNPEKHLPLYMLTQSLIEYDETLGFWRVHHLRVVERMLGRKLGTGGSGGVEYLQLTTGKRCFPVLWEVVSYLKGPES